MALITFRDSQGSAWRVWNVSRESLTTTQTDYLGQEYRTGWLVFQREGSDERRRLAQFPDDWSSLSPLQLEHMCTSARPVGPTRLSGEGRDVTREAPRFGR